MKDQIRITVSHLVDYKVIIDQAILKINGIYELGFNHKQQINIIKGFQEELLKMQSEYLKESIEICIKCNSKLKHSPKAQSNFHSIFADHKISVKRNRCCNPECGWTSVPSSSTSSLFKNNIHPYLSKIQSEITCNYTYRETQKIINSYSYYSRKVNNHEHIYRNVEVVGNYISNHQTTELQNNISPAKELICQVDGGHLKSKKEDNRSFEALDSIIYSPNNVIFSKTAVNSDDTIRGQITSKHCAAPVLNDELKTIKHQILIINYAKRYNSGKISSSSSSVAESNIEKLINKSCKAKQHMQWSSYGIYLLLQIRASCASKYWYYFWRQYVLKAMTQNAA